MAGYGNAMNPMGYMMPTSAYPTYTNQNMNSYNAIQTQMPSPYTSPMTNQLNMANSVGIPGRVINNETEITPNEVPMDGRMSVFPKNDYSSIIAKWWDSDGDLRMVKFVPEIDGGASSVIKTDVTTEATQNILDQVNETINSRFDDIERLIKRNNYKKPYKKPYDKKIQNGSESND